MARDFKTMCCLTWRVPFCYEQHITAINRLLRTYPPIELIPDAIPYTVPCDFRFKKFSELHQWIDHGDAIAVRGLNIHSYTSGDSSQASLARDYIIVDEEKKPLIVRFWGDMIDNDFNQVSAKFPEPTMVVMLNVKVTTYHGLSLGTKNNTCVFHNPPLRAGPSLIECRYNKNSVAVTDMILGEAYKDTDVLLPLPSSDDLVPISEVHDLIDVRKAVWVCGSFQLMPNQQKLWYKNTAADLKASDEKNVSLTREIDLPMRQKEVVRFIKCLDRLFEGNNVPTYPVLKMYLKSELTGRETQISASTGSSDAGICTVFPAAEGVETKETQGVDDPLSLIFFPLKLGKQVGRL